MEGEELLVDTVKLLEINIKSENENNNNNEKVKDTLDEILINLEKNPIKEEKKEDKKEENMINDIIKLIISSSSINNNSIHNTIRISYPEIQQTHDIKIKSPICDQCFRLVYIFFDYIQNYIIIICSYCNKMSVYNCCNKCYKSFLYF